MSEEVKPRPKIERNRLELISFETDEAARQAIRVLIDLGEEHRITSYKVNEWWVRTNFVRRLQEFGVPFEWLTENA